MALDINVKNMVGEDSHKSILIISHQAFSTMTKEYCMLSTF